MTHKIIYLALGGTAGTLARYYISTFVQRFGNGNFPIGTLAVNMLGCFLFGTIWGFFENRVLPNHEYRLFVLTGFMGAFTTFSTYMFETAGLVKLGQIPFALLNVIGQSLLGLTLVLLGLALGRLL